MTRSTFDHPATCDCPECQGYVGHKFFVGLGWAAVLTLAGAAIVVGFIALLSLRMS